MKRLLLLVSVLLPACDSAEPDIGISGEYRGVLLGEGHGFIGTEFEARAQVEVTLVQTGDRIEGFGRIDGWLYSDVNSIAWVRDITISGVEQMEEDRLVYALDVYDGCETQKMRASTLEYESAGDSQTLLSIWGWMQPTASFPSCVWLWGSVNSVVRLTRR